MLPIRFLPHSVEILTNAITAWINQIESLAPDEAVALIEESAGSETDREFVAAREINSVLPIVTSDLSFLTTCGMSGLPITSGSSKPGLVAWGRELPLGAVPTAIATAHHMQLAVSDGLLVPMSVRASNNAVAKLTLILHAILGTSGTSGATPFVWTADTAITSGAGQTANIYTTGPVKYTISGGSSRLVQGIADLGIDFGIGVLKESSDGEVYPSHISIVARMSKIMFTTKDVELVTEIGDGVSVSSFAAFFRNMDADGQRVAPATTSHVSATGTAGMITPGATTLTHRQAGTTAYTFTPAKNTNLLTLSTTAAIPTS